MIKREVRTISNAQLRAKADKMGATGYAAVFNQSTELPWFREVVLPGAFKRALAEKQDVRALQNHDANIVLGRTKAGTLDLQEDATGLRFDVDFPDTQAAKDLHASMQRGDVDGCSFGFVVRQQNWREEKLADGSRQETREIVDADLLDVSIATYPAYEGALCEARSLWPDGAPAEVEAHRGNKPEENGQAQNSGQRDDAEALAEEHADERRRVRAEAALRL